MYIPDKDPAFLGLSRALSKTCSGIHVCPRVNKSPQLPEVGIQISNKRKHLGPAALTKATAAAAVWVKWGRFKCNFHPCRFCVRMLLGCSETSRFVCGSPRLAAADHISASNLSPVVWRGAALSISSSAVQPQTVYYASAVEKEVYKEDLHVGLMGEGNVFGRDQ